MKTKTEPNVETPARWNVLSLLGAKSKKLPEASTTQDGSCPEPVIPANARKILVVDDDEVVRKSTAMKLKAHGYAVSTAADGPSALQAARKEHPDLILLDLSFPPDVAMTWDGFSILAWLRRLEETKRVPVVILTGQQGESSYEKARNAGVAGFFHKPIDFRPLISLIELRLKAAAASQPNNAVDAGKD